ncbi:MAG: peptide deformylase [Veillonella sp.]|nr:peptide deformylase [Veillonella sp.]
MIKDIVKDTFFLQQKSRPATEADTQIGQDLLDTLEAHKDHCVGLAANMIGQAVCIIALRVGDGSLLMYNPVYKKVSPKTYDTEEGCLSLTGVRPVTRYEWVEVEFRDQNFKKQVAKFKGFEAEIIQHEVDHCQGILI